MTQRTTSDLARQVTQSHEVLTLNPLMQFTFEGQPELWLPLEGRRFNTTETRMLEAIAALEDGSTFDEGVQALTRERVCATDREARDVLAELLRAEVMAVGEVPQRWVTAQTWIDRGWTDALLFHLQGEPDRFADEAIDDIDSVNDERLRERSRTEQPATWHRYPGRAVSLPQPRDPQALPPLEEVLLRRRSNLPWRSGSATLEQVATMAHLASRETVAVRRRYEEEVANRPSTMLLSPFTALELYLAAHKVEGLTSGVYHYEPDTHRLVEVIDGDVREGLQRMCVGQHRAGDGAGTWIVTAVWQRFMWRYRQPSAYRTLMVNTGELAQKLIVLASALDLSTFLTPAFDDQYADELLRMNPGVESPVEVVAFG